jgi:beta-glucosidase
MVETDWGVKNDPVKEVKAGNDLKMPTGYPDELKAAVENGELTRAELELCAKRIIEMMIRMAD